MTLPLVLVHGFIGGSAQWNGLVASLEEYDIGTVPVDLPGFGANAHLRPIARIGDFADWVIAETRRKGVDQYNLLGHSMGGMIAQEIARRDSDRVKRLILSATGASGVLPGRFETIEESKRRAEEDGARATARRIAATWFLEGEMAQGYEDCAAIAERAGLDAILAGLDAMQSWSGETALSQIGQETLIIWGEKDRTYRWEQIETLWKRIPRTHLAVLPTCAHAVHLENPKLFSAIVREILV